MKIIFSEQYNKPCIVPDRESIAEIMEGCREHGAIYDDGEGELYVVQIRGHIGPELWTERALGGQGETF